MAPSEWGSPDAAPWAALWARYDAVLQSVQKDGLATLDRWYLTTLPATLHAHDPGPYMTQPELVTLVEWKLKKGKWRPQLMKYVTSLAAKDVKAASLQALQKLKDGNLRAATEALSALKGVRNARYCGQFFYVLKPHPNNAASLISGGTCDGVGGAAYDNSVPFMGDEALEAIAAMIGPRKYTLPHFLSFAEQVRAKATWLNDQCTAPADDKAESRQTWTAQRVQLCLYAEAHDGKVATSATAKAASSTAAKRKRKPVTPPPAVQEEKVERKEGGEVQDESVRRSQRKRRRPAA